MGPVVNAKAQIGGSLRRRERERPAREREPDRIFCPANAHCRSGRPGRPPFRKINLTIAIQGCKRVFVDEPFPVAVIRFHEGPLPETRDDGWRRELRRTDRSWESSADGRCTLVQPAP